MHYLKNLALGLAFAAVCGSSVPVQADTFQGERSDFRDETIYFAMTTRFYDGDPMNNVCSWDKADIQIANGDPDWRGDFAGLIQKLDYIKALGFTAIWITPITQNASGEDYHGYHSMDLSSVDLRLESRKDWGCANDVKFQDLIDAAHAKGLKIVLDVVLQHTSNFGEAFLNPLFTRDQNIRNQATPAGSLIPNERLSSNYFDQDPKVQYEERFKYFKNPQYDKHNYYHHYGTGWNWDYPNRWWGQIAGDCVDLNTENDVVADYVVKSYGKFIEMGVDGFRIDTAGHIAPLTFNKQFIPQFHAIAEKAKNKRLNGCPFFMFGEVCQRYQGSVVYREQANLSSYFYTWKSDDSLLNQFDGSQEFWDQQVLNEGHDTPVGPMAVCEKDTKDKPRSKNALMENGKWHTPDYSQASGFNVIDFPVHYSFSSVGSVMGLFNQDNYYNDATYNVVYVDSHDYCPGPNDQQRFNGGTSQWAENLSFMFTFRGIPCIYYGSEVEFKKGQQIDVGGQAKPRKDSGRAYFGEYLEGSVSASDFGVYTASGNVAKTLDGDLAHHVRRLNMIRAAVPALRKGQYTFDGCNASGGWAFKRAYKDESYCLVAVNGGATFTGVPAGTYVDVVTGKSYTGGGTITVDAPHNQGQLRVLVKDWKGGKIGTDGKFMYESSPVAHGGSVTFEDKPTDKFYTGKDVIGQAAVTFTPAGGTFKSETLSVTAELNEVATSGWYQIGDAKRVTLTKGKPADFTIGEGLAYGSTITVKWGADDKSGSVTYKKVDPNAVITIYVAAKGNADISGTNLYAWNTKGTEFCGAWPGKAMTETKEIDGRTFYYYTIDDAGPVNIVINRGSSKTNDITGLTEDAFFEYDGSTNATKVDVVVGPKAPVIRATPASGTTFHNPINVTLTCSNADAIYYTTDGTDPSVSSMKYTQPINVTKTTTIKAYAKNDAGETRTSFTYTYQDTPVVTTYTAYFDNTDNWGDVYAYCWDDNHMVETAFSGKWPGQKLSTVTYNGKTLYKFSFQPQDEVSNLQIIFNNNGGAQTGDCEFVNNAIYGPQGMISTGVDSVAADSFKVSANQGDLMITCSEATVVAICSIDGTVTYYNAQPGLNVVEGLAKGLYIVNGQKVMLR